MKKTVMTLLSMPFLMTMLILGVSPEASADGIKGVVIINCGIKFGESSPDDPFPFPESIGYEVPFSSSSAGSPIVTSGADCAQAVADVLSAGFKLQIVKGTGSGDLNYILIKN
jgi:hypothetical protein